VTMRPSGTVMEIWRLKCWTHGRGHLKKAPYFGSSGCSKVIDVDTTELLVTSACCDRQHAHAYSVSATVFTKDWPTMVK